jgi:nicotinamidase-related amidase
MIQPDNSLTQQNAAMIFIDLQAGPLMTIGSIDQEELRANVAKLAQVAALYMLPVVVAAGTQTGPGGAVIPEVTAHLTEPMIVRHSTPNALRMSVFAEAVVETGRTHLILAGIALDVGVLLTALGLRTAGYSVYVVADATGAVTTRAEEAAFARLRHAGVIVSSWASLAAEIQEDFAAPHGDALLELLHPQLKTDTHKVL